MHKYLSNDEIKGNYSNQHLLYLPIKRTLDIFLSLFGLLFMLLFSLIIKGLYLINFDKESIFYIQERIGKDGIPFKMYKFRTMIPNADKVLEEILKDKDLKMEWDKNHKLKNDPRITRIGMFLRKTSIDEMPQFINVLKGDMSLVGPRPLVSGELESHNGSVIYNYIKPGITGWWACNGRSNIQYYERLELEYYYVEHFSLFLDILTLLKTIVCVVQKTGAQ